MNEIPVLNPELMGKMQSNSVDYSDITPDLHMQLKGRVSPKDIILPITKYYLKVDIYFISYM